MFDEGSEKSIKTVDLACLEFLYLKSGISTILLKKSAVEFFVENPIKMWKHSFLLEIISPMEANRSLTKPPHDRKKILSSQLTTQSPAASEPGR